MSRLGLCLSLTLLCGCGQKAVSNTVAVLKEQVQQATQPAESSFELQFSNDSDLVVVKGGQMSSVAMGDRPLVVQLTSYVPGTEPTSHKLLLRVTQKSKSVAELHGKTVPGQIYYQRFPTVQPFYSLPEPPANITFEYAADNYVVVALKDVALHDVTGSEVCKLSGKLTALRGEQAAEAKP